MRMPMIIMITILMIPGGLFSQESPAPDEHVEAQVEQPATESSFAEITKASEDTAKTTEQNAEPVQPTEPAIVPTETVAPQQEATSLPAEESTHQEPASQQEIQPQEVASQEEAAFVIPAEPEPMADEIVTVPEISSEREEPTGIDTVSLENPQGNWLFKRIWWERAEERYEKIRQLVDAIWESRTEFFVKRNDLDRNILRPFYINVGLEKGELQEILAEINDFLEKKREQQGDLNEQERMLYESYATEEETLKQLKIDIDSLATLDDEIDNALGTLMDQINRVRQFEEQAWQNFREIARILNDTKARELYYIIEGAARNIKNIGNYLEHAFLNHFNTLIDEAKKHVSKVQKQMEALKEKGVSFKRQEDLLQQKEQAQQEEENEEEETAPKPKLSWFGWIMSWFTGAFNMILSIVSMPYNMLFGK